MFILRYRKSIFEQFDLKRTSTVVITHHVKTHGRPSGRRLRYSRAMPAISRRFSRSTAASAGFTSRDVRVFTSTKQSTSPTQPARVDFSSAEWRSIIASPDNVASSAQVEVGFLLSSATRALIECKRVA